MDESGGDPACWQHLVCDSCGRVHDEGERCDAAPAFDPADFAGRTIVVAYGDANALRRGVAHAVLRDVLLHGPLDAGVGIEDDVTAWVEAFAQVRGAWLAEAFGVPAADAARPIATALNAIIASAGRPLELVLDEDPCVDCAVAHQLVAAVAEAAGAQLIDPPQTRVALTDLGAWRDAQLTELPVWVDDALAATAAEGGTVADAWQRLSERSSGTGLADLTSMRLFAQRLAANDAPARLGDGHAPEELVPACAHGTLSALRLEPASPGTPSPSRE